MPTAKALPSAEHLVAVDRSNTESQVHLVSGLYTISTVSDVPHARAALRNALAILDTLAREGTLPAAQQDWPTLLQTELKQLPPEAAER